MEAIFRNLEKGPYGCIRKVGPRRSEAFSILKRRCTLAMSPRFDNTRASSRVAIIRRVFTRRSWTDFSDASVRAFFQVPENRFHDLLNEDTSSSVRFMEPRRVASA